MSHLSCTLWSQLSGVLLVMICVWQGLFQGVVTSSASLFMIITISSRIWVCPVFQMTLIEESVDWTSLQWRNGTSRGVLLHPLLLLPSNFMLPRSPSILWVSLLETHSSQIVKTRGDSWIKEWLSHSHIPDTPTKLPNVLSNEKITSQPTWATAYQHLNWVIVWTRGLLYCPKERQWHLPIRKP